MATDLQKGVAWQNSEIREFVHANFPSVDISKTREAHAITLTRTFKRPTFREEGQLICEAFINGQPFFKRYGAPTEKLIRYYFRKLV